MVAKPIRLLDALIALVLLLDLASCAGIKSANGTDGAARDVAASVEVSLADLRGRDRDGAGQVIGTGSLGDAACASRSQQGERVALDLYLMLDSSGSMSELTASGQTKWAAAQAALTTFLQNPQSAGLGVGLEYFPLLRPMLPDQCATDAVCTGGGTCLLERACNSPTNPTACTTNADCPARIACVPVGACFDPARNVILCYPAQPGFICNNDPTNPCAPIPGYCSNRDLCGPADYATPAVEIATLPGAAPALVTSLGRRVPDGLTPTGAALSGAISHAQAWGRANPTHRVAVVLATDGFPTECTPVDIPGVAALASTAAAGTPAVSTFVIGVFAPAEQADARINLDAIASAGGTGTAFLIDTSQNVTQGFVSALNAIRTMALSCEYQVPVPPADGGVPDYFAVNVEFTSGAGQTVTIGNVHDRASCSPTQGGWYYDVDPNTGAAPRTINICPTACTQLQADTAGRVDILLGCTTVVIVP